MPQYIVTDNAGTLRHNGEKYKPGDPVEMSEKEAKALEKYAALQVAPGDSILTPPPPEVQPIEPVTMSPSPLTKPSLPSMNSASREDLLALPNIGKLTAEAIEKGRPYASLDEVKEKALPMLSDEKWQQLQSLIVL
jgi:DNA uptake protein ComE-like DNA-binding protein